MGRADKILNEGSIHNPEHHAVLKKNGYQVTSRAPKLGDTYQHKSDPHKTAFVSKSGTELRHKNAVTKKMHHDMDAQSVQQHVDKAHNSDSKKSGSRADNLVKSTPAGGHESHPMHKTVHDAGYRHTSDSHKGHEYQHDNGSKVILHRKVNGLGRDGASVYPKGDDSRKDTVKHHTTQKDLKAHLSSGKVGGMATPSHPLHKDATARGFEHTKTSHYTDRQGNKQTNHTYKHSDGRSITLSSHRGKGEITRHEYTTPRGMPSTESTAARHPNDHIKDIKGAFKHDMDHESHSSGGKHHVDGYTRKDGVKVAGYDY